MSRPIHPVTLAAAAPACPCVAYAGGARARPLWLALAAPLAVSGVLLAAGPVDAKAQALTAAPVVLASRSFDIPAGPLDGVLARFIREAGVPLAVAPDLIQDRQSPGLRGTFDVPTGLRTLLVGTGLTASRSAQGAYLLQPAPGVSTLSPVTVHGALPGVTEATQSYRMAGPVTAATALPLTVRETPQSVSVLTRQRIEDEALDSIETLMDRAPGISVQNVGSSRFSINSRGYAMDRYQLDGIGTATDFVSQNIPQSQSDLAIYDRVEVVRGATGLLSGAGDPSGTINLVRKKPTAAFQAHASVGVSSFGSGRGEVDLSGPVNAAGTLRARMVAAHEQGDTHIDFYRQNKSVLYGVLEADLAARTVLTAGVDYQRNDPRGQSSSGLPLFYDTGERTAFSPAQNAAARWSRNRIEVYNAFVQLEQGLANDWTVKLAANRLHGSRSFDGADASWGFPNRETGDGVMLYGGLGTAKQRQTGIDAQLQGPFSVGGREHEFVLGMSWAQFENLHAPMDGDELEGRDVNLYDWNNDTARGVVTGQKLMDYDGWEKQSGVYSALRFKPRDDLAVIVGARVSNYRYQLSQVYTDSDWAANNRVTRMRERGVVTPYAGIVYDINDRHAVYASYTSIFKPQSYRDRDGNVLDPREGDNYEVGVKSAFFDGRLTSAVALYQIRQSNLAEVDPGVFVPNTQREAAYRAVDGARTSGLDIELNGEILPGWQVALSYGYSRSKDAEGEAIRTVFPRHMAKLWTTYRLSGDWHRLTVGGGINAQSRIHFTTTTWSLPGITLTGEQKPYVVANLMARYDFDRHLSATLNLNNVFDKKYLQGLDTTFYTGIYAPTRNAVLNLRYTF